MSLQFWHPESELLHDALEATNTGKYLLLLRPEEVYKIVMGTNCPRMIGLVT